MGGWAFYSNAEYGFATALTSGTAQGIMSGLLTLFLKKSVDLIRARTPVALKLWVPPIISGAASASLLISIHWLIGTPEIVKTIIVPLGVSLSYVFIYNALNVKNG